MNSPASLTTIRPELIQFNAEQLRLVMPFVIVLAGTLLAVVASVLRIINAKWAVFVISMGTAIAGAISAFELIGEPSVALFNGMWQADGFGNFFCALFLACFAFTALSSLRYLDQEKLPAPEFFVLGLFSAMGMMFLATTVDLIVIFIALELMSLSVYAMVGYRRADRRSNEAAMKYFVLGGLASAVLLYGAALLYGATGSTNLVAILKTVQAGQAPSAVFVLGLAFTLLGFLFKVAAVPFHMWMPDVYEGAPAPVTGFMTTGLKAAAFACFVRVLAHLGYGNGLAAGVQDSLHDVLWWVAIATMVLGNAVALTQSSLKRMLAYSSIAHTGYLLVGMLSAPGSELGYAPVLMYLVSYSAMNLGAFALLTILAGKEDSGLTLADLSGLARRRPAMAFALAVFMFSMAGIPPTAGFAAKYLLFYGAVQAREIPLVVVSVLCSAISVYYYLRVLVFAYMKEPTEGDSSVAAPRGSAFATLSLALLAGITLQVGLMPSGWVALAKAAVAQLLG